MNPRRNLFLRFIAWLGTHEAVVLCAWGALAAGPLVFAFIAGEVKEGGTLAFDRDLLLAMRRPGDLSLKGSPPVQEAARDVTALGGTLVITLLTASTAGFLALDGKRRMAGFLCLSILTGAIASNILKNAFHRQRPQLVPHAMYAASGSFPSGHSMLSALTYLTIGALLARSHARKRIKVYCLFLAVLLTFSIGVSRVYLGVHWPTDVLAGWTAGAVWALLCWIAARQLQRRHALERESEHTWNEFPA
jgi:undecaprenyl-diphosphatase